MPAVMFVAPVWLFAPDNVHVPVPDFISVPDVVLRMLARLPLPVPPIVRAKPGPVIIPVFVRSMSPADKIMLVALPSLRSRYKLH